MKGMIAIGLACLAIGYGLGQGRKVESKELGVKADDLRASNRVSNHQDQSRETPEERRARRENELHRFVKDLKCGYLGEFTQMRIGAWILSLEAREFPEVIMLISSSEGFQGDFGDPFSDPRDYIRLALARWYELEGESVIAWIGSNPAELEGLKLLNVEEQLILDGFHQSPNRSFDQLRELFVRKFKRKNPGDVPNRESLCYMAGRWSSDALSKMNELRKMEEGGELTTSSDSPFAGMEENGEVGAFVEGLMDAGREDLVREFAQIMGGEFQASINAVMWSRIADDGGWREVKARMEAGGHSNSGWSGYVMRQWAQEDFAAAVGWYLDQDKGGEGEREYQLAEIVDRYGPLRFSIQEGNYREAINWVQSMEDQGEPVGEAWESLVNSAFSDGDYELVDFLRKKTPSLDWRDYEKRLISSAATSHSIRIEGESHSFFSTRARGSEAVRGVERYDLQERLDQFVAEKNKSSLEALHQWLGVEER